MILVGLGSNLPFLGLPSDQIVARAIEALGLLGALERASPLYGAPAWPNEADPPFVNAVAAISTNLDPRSLLTALSGIESGFGRRRGVRNAPRTLDLDLLDYHGRIWVATAVTNLRLPHPGIAQRDFVLAPLLDVAPHWTDPVGGESGRALLSRLPRPSARPL